MPASQKSKRLSHAVALGMLVFTSTQVLESCKLVSKVKDPPSRLNGARRDFSPLPFDKVDGDTGSDDGVFVPMNPGGTKAEIGRILVDTTMWGNGKTCKLLKGESVTVVAKSEIKGESVFIVQTQTCLFDGAPYFEGYLKVSDLVLNPASTPSGKDGGFDGGKGGKGGNDPFIPDPSNPPTQPPQSPTPSTPPSVVPPTNLSSTCIEVGHVAHKTVGDTYGLDYCYGPDTMPVDVRAKYDGLIAKANATTDAGLKQSLQNESQNISMQYSSLCLVAGNSYRNSGKFSNGGEYGFQIKAVIPDGGALRLRVTHDGASKSRATSVAHSYYSSIVFEKTFAKSELKTINTNVYEVPFSNIIPTNDISAAKATIQADVLSSMVPPKQVGSSCRHVFMLASPIVLDFRYDQGQMPTVSLATSQARFDMEATGQRVSTGWIASGTSLLALDRNQNGIIDSGAELFGDQTHLENGLRAANGYEALREFDDNHDGEISAEDQIYRHLRLWFDDNQDGISDEGEVFSLKQMKVSRISLRYGKNSLSHQSQGINQILENDVRYFAKFWGPNFCGDDGCNSFDVYFSMSREQR